LFYTIFGTKTTPGRRGEGAAGNSLDPTTQNITLEFGNADLENSNILLHFPKYAFFWYHDLTRFIPFKRVYLKGGVENVGERE
jgi:hypothetical protein